MQRFAGAISSCGREHLERRRLRVLRSTGRAIEDLTDSRSSDLAGDEVEKIAVEGLILSCGSGLQRSPRLIGHAPNL